MSQACSIWDDVAFWLLFAGFVLYVLGDALQWFAGKIK